MVGVYGMTFMIWGSIFGVSGVSVEQVCGTAREIRQRLQGKTKDTKD